MVTIYIHYVFFPSFQFNSKKIDKKKEELNFLYNCQQNWNPKQTIILKHIITYNNLQKYINLKAYINPKGMIGMPVTDRYVWDHAYRHDIFSLYARHMKIIMSFIWMKFSW
jgi:hypothetical protein